jgi:teichuronic acid exporter
MIKRYTIIKSLIFKGIERLGSQGIVFAVNIILARLLIPSDYGILALLTVFILISQVLIQSGLNTALIQKKETDDIDFSSVFYTSLVAAMFLYAILFITSPFIASYYNMPGLKNILRILSIILFPGAFNSIQVARVSRDMQFSKLMYSNLGAVIISGAVGIGMAYSGLGVWALVGQQIVNQISVCVIMWFAVKWRPKKIFNFSRVKSLFSFGWKLLASTLLDTIYNNLQNVIIGKKYTSSILGYYNRGNQFPQFIITNINGAIQSVMLPALSSEQDDRARLKAMTRRSIKTSSYFVMPCMAGIIAAASPLVSVLLTDKWLPCVPFLQLMCVTYAVWPIHTANLQVLNAIGRSDLFLKLEIIKKTYGIIVLLITVLCFDNVMAIVIGGTIVMPVGLIVNAFPNKKILDYSLFDQIKDIMPSVILSSIMGVGIYLINFIGLNNIITLLMQILIGFTFYFFTSYILKFEALSYILNILHEHRSQKEIS